jgi:hypothetical protein
VVFALSALEVIVVVQRDLTVIVTVESDGMWISSDSIVIKERPCVLADLQRRVARQGVGMTSGIAVRPQDS